MELKDKIRRMQGFLILRWNKEIPVMYKNLVMNAGLRKIGDILDGTETSNLSFTKFGAGSGSTSVAYTDTALETEIGKISGQSTGYPTRDGDILQNSFQVGSAELVGTWREVALFFADDVIWCHINVAERAKASGDIVSIWYYVDLIN